MDNGEIPEPFAFEVRTYGHSPSGYVVNERIAIDGEFPDWFPRFVTTVVHSIQVKQRHPTTGQVVLQEHQKAAPNVPIPGEDIFEAMVALPAIVKQTSERLHAEMMAKLTGKTLIMPGDPGFRR